MQRRDGGRFRGTAKGTHSSAASCALVWLLGLAALAPALLADCVSGTDASGGGYFVVKTSFISSIFIADSNCNKDHSKNVTWLSMTNVQLQAVSPLPKIWAGSNDPQ